MNEISAKDLCRTMACGMANKASVSFKFYTLCSTYFILFVLLFREVLPKNLQNKRFLAVFVLILLFVVHNK